MQLQSCPTGTLANGEIHRELHAIAACGAAGSAAKTCRWARKLSVMLLSPYMEERRKKNTTAL